MPNPAKIVFVAGLGAQLRDFVAPLAARLQSRGVETVGIAGSMCELTGFSHQYELAPFRRGSLISMARAQIELIRIIKKEKPNLIHAHTPSGNAIGRIAGWVNGVPSVAVVHSTFLGQPGVLGRLFPLLEAPLSSVAACTVVLNSEDAAFYSRHSRGRPILTAPVGGMGIDTERIAHARLHPHRSTSRTAVIVGRLNHEKNLDLAFEAFREVREADPSVNLLVIGAALSGDSAWTVPAEGYVRHIDWTPDPYPYMAGSDVLLSASPREAFPMVLAEALLLGTPVACISNRGVRELEKARPFGLHVAASDTSSLAAAIKTALGDSRDPDKNSHLEGAWSRQSALRFHAQYLTDLFSVGLATSEID